MQQWMKKRYDVLPTGQWFSSSVWFSLKMLFAATVSILGLFFILMIVARMDVAFFESNGMIQNPDIRNAFYVQIFQLDDVLIAMIAIGLLAVAVISFMFCKSQFNYFRHLERSLRLFAEKWESPPTVLLGRFNPHMTYFFEILGRRINGETEGALEPLIGRARQNWPKLPTVSWADQMQFAAVSGVLGLFFSSVAYMVYLKVSGRVVELANQIVRFPTPTGPSFLTEQFDIVGTLVWAVLGLTTLTFVVTGYRFGRRISEADYAILRDIRGFMEGNLKQRLFLRRNDPAEEQVASMNMSLEQIAQKLRNPGADPKGAQSSGT